MAARVILTLDRWWIKRPIKPRMVDDRGSMSLMICRGHIRACRGTFQIFFCMTVLWQIDIKSNFALWSSFKVTFERVVNGLGGQNCSQLSI